MANSAILGQNSPKIIIIIIIKMQNYYFGDIICTPHHLIAITGPNPEPQPTHETVYMVHVLDC